MYHTPCFGLQDYFYTTSLFFIKSLAESNKSWLRLGLGCYTNANITANYTKKKVLLFVSVQFCS